MQFILPETPNFYDYFSRLTSFHKVVLVATLLSFVGSGSGLALGVYQIISPRPASSVPAARGIASPIGFFGKLSSEKSEATQNKTVASPLNGVFYSSEEAALWQARRPLAVTLNNHVLARPQTGLSQADIIYEAVAEGGITRLLAIFHSRLPEKVGPVRSARVHFADFAKENEAWLGHWGGWKNGGPADVYDRMRRIFVNSIDAMDGRFSSAFFRDFSNAGLPLEHTGFSLPEKILELAYQTYPDQPRPLPEEFSRWPFKEEAAASERGAAQKVSFNFWDVPDFTVAWEYDSKDNVYQRFQGGQIQTDAENGRALSAKNVIILFMDERSLNDGYGHLLYQTTGEGLGKVFLDGRVLDISWVRPKVSERTRFLVGAKSRPEELKLNRGQIWIEILPTGTPVAID